MSLKVVDSQIRRSADSQILTTLNDEHHTAVSQLVAGASLCVELKLIFRRCHVVFRAEMTAEGNAQTKFVCLLGCVATSWGTGKQRKARRRTTEPGPR